MIRIYSGIAVPLSYENYQADLQFLGIKLDVLKPNPSKDEIKEFHSTIVDNRMYVSNKKYVFTYYLNNKSRTCTAFICTMINIRYFGMGEVYHFDSNISNDKINQFTDFLKSKQLDYPHRNHIIVDQL